FVKRASKKGFHFKIYRDPQFIFSWRRFKRTGTIKTLQRYALLNLKRLVEADINQEKDYPMGGKVTISDQSTQNLVNKIINTLDTGKKIPSILKKIKAIITLTEEE
ncbi:hypothetical protein HYS10_00975, partial [Candidatus Collierbacteria bacterium]|nr:hypothetical protein [Candidatus Collierbacteria bacterium]